MDNIKQLIPTKIRMSKVLRKRKERIKNSFEDSVNKRQKREEFYLPPEVLNDVKKWNDGLK